MDFAKKRERASNFNKSEVRLLTELVTKYRHIIENKKTDAVTNKEKDAAWTSIATTFNAASSGTTTRTAKTLKLKYESIKKGTKKKMTIHRQEMYKTGGGPSAAPDLDDVEEKVLAICSNITGLDARNDSDYITGVNNDLIVPDKPDIKAKSQEDIFYANEIIVEEIHEENIDVAMNDENILNKSVVLNSGDDDDNESKKDSNSKWSTWNPKALKTKVSQALKPSKSSVTQKLDKLSAARLELVLLQQEIAKKEHGFAKEEHDAKMLSLRNDEIRKQEIHQLMLNTMQRRE